MTFRFLPALVFAGALAWAGCDSDDPTPTDTFPFNPDTVDFDRIQDLDYGDFVQPLLAYRDVFAATPPDVDEDPTVRLARYTWAALFEGDTPEGETVIPFDADESLIVKLVEALGDSTDIPYPNLRTLQEDEVRYLRRWIEAGAKSDDGTVPFADAEALLYVCNQLAGRVAIVDAARLQVIRYVYFADLGEPGDMMGALPHHVAVEPDGSAWYVTLIAGTGGGSILKLSTDLTMDPSDAAYLLARETPPDGEDTFQKPGMMALDPTSNRLYAGRSFSADPNSQGIAAVDRSTMDFVVYPTLNNNHPHAIGVSPNGRWVLTAALDPPNVISSIDAATGDLVDQETLPDTDRLGFVHYDAAPDGRTFVLTSQTSAELFILDLDPDTGELSIEARVDVGMQPWHPIFSPDGATVYVPNRASHSVSFVEMASRVVIETVQNDEANVVFSEPHGAALSADGRTLFVANRNTQQLPSAPVRPAPYPFLNEEGSERPATDFGFVTVIDTETKAVTAVISTGKWASGMALYDPR